MLVECRGEEELFSIPKFTVEKDNVEDFIKDLIGFHEHFIDCFSRSETRENFYRYMVGQLSELERKSIEHFSLFQISKHSPSAPPHPRWNNLRHQEYLKRKI